MYVNISQIVNQFHTDSFNQHFELDSLDEVRLVVKNLKKGKAVGVDGIFNEVFKYGGDRVCGNYTMEFF